MRRALYSFLVAITASVIACGSSNEIPGKVLDLEYVLQETVAVTADGRIFAATLTEAGNGIDGKLVAIDHTGEVELLDGHLRLRYLTEFDGFYGELREVIPTEDRGHLQFIDARTDGDPESHSLVVKRSESLQVEWEKQFRPPGCCIGQAADGGYYMAGGYIREPPDNVEIGWVRRIDPLGETTWEIQIDTFYLFQVLPTPDGGVAVAGRQLPRVDENTVWLMKFDDSGQSQWQVAIDIPSPCLIRCTREGDFIAMSRFRGVVTRVSSGGVVQWNSTVSIFDAMNLTETNDGNLVIVGTAEEQGTIDAAVVWLDRDGNVSRMKTYGGHDTDFAIFTLEVDGSLRILGKTMFSPSSDLYNQDASRAYWMIRIDSEGEVF